MKVPCLAPLTPLASALIAGNLHTDGYADSCSHHYLEDWAGGGEKGEGLKATPPPPPNILLIVVVKSAASKGPAGQTIMIQTGYYSLCSSRVSSFLGQQSSCQSLQGTHGVPFTLSSPWAHVPLLCTNWADKAGCRGFCWCVCSNAFPSTWYEIRAFSSFNRVRDGCLFSP